MKRHLHLVYSSRFFSRTLLKHLVCPSYRKGSRTKSCDLAMKGSSRPITPGTLVSPSTTSRVLAWVHLLKRCVSTSRIYRNQHHHLWLRSKMMFRTQRASQATRATQVIPPTAPIAGRAPDREHRLDELAATANLSHDRGLDHYRELLHVGPLLDEGHPPDLSLRHPRRAPARGRPRSASVSRSPPRKRRARSYSSSISRSPPRRRARSYSRSISRSTISAATPGFTWRWARPGTISTGEEREEELQLG